MNEKRFSLKEWEDLNYCEHCFYDGESQLSDSDVVVLLNEQQELIEELHSSDEMGWGRAEHFEKELKQKRIYIKRLEYKVQKFKEMNGEQQAIIQSLKEENEKLRFLIDINSFSERKKLERQVDEQQSTITNLKGDVNRLQYIIDELKKDNYKRFEKINELKAKLKEKKEDEKNRLNDEYIKECSL